MFKQTEAFWKDRRNDRHRSGCHFADQFLDHPTPDQSARRKMLFATRFARLPAWRARPRAGSPTISVHWCRTASSRSLHQVPVVAAWSVAEEYADKNDMKFRTPSLQPAQPKKPAGRIRAPRPGDVSGGSLAQGIFRARVAQGTKRSMRYAQPVRITQDCLVCHGGPVGTKGPFGCAKEGMKVGDLRGAFAVTASTEQLASMARSNSIATFLLSFLTLLALPPTVIPGDSQTGDPPARQIG